MQMKGKIMGTVLAVTLALSGIQPAYATKQEVRVEKEKASVMQEEKKKLEDSLKKLEGLKNDTAAYVKELDGQMETLSRELDSINAQINEKETEITEIGEDLEVAKQTEENQYGDMKMRIKYMYEHGQTRFLDMLLQSEDMGQFLNRAEYIREISDYDRTKLREYAENKQKIADHEAKLESDHAELVTLREQNEAKQESVQTLLATKNEELNNYQGQIQTAQGQISQYEQDIKAQEKKISFSVQRRGSFADQYLFDREKLNEALSAILENAVKYTQPEGSVFFIIELFTRGEQETIFRFEIRDNGIGMEQNFLPHIFDAFAQEDDRNTTLSGGTGLGLTISKNIIDFMGGKIDVYSEKGKGSAFVVTVPLKTAKEDRRRTERTTYQEYDFSGKRVLLVEDNEINIEITRNILIHKNFMVDIAENGKAGVEQFLKHEPGYYDVILMDIRMPVMDGLAATRCIRESDHSDSKTVPIVAMTANVFEEDVKKSFDAGMNAHLSKPVDIKQMYAVLDELVTGDGLL